MLKESMGSFPLNKPRLDPDFQNSRKTHFVAVCGRFILEQEFSVALQAVLVLVFNTSRWAFSLLQRVEKQIRCFRALTGASFLHPLDQFVRQNIQSLLSPC